MNLSNEPDSRSDDEEEIPGLWPYSISDEHCCIYRVPSHLRRLNPEAYTPKMLLIGPLHHSKKFDKTDLRYVDYKNMERYKTKYLKEIADTYGAQTVEEFRRTIEGNEQIIRASYAESTEWIKSKEFVKMILFDSVFILQFMFIIPERQLRNRIPKNTRDILVDQPCLRCIILDDLVLLENQLPLFILTELFEPFFIKLESNQTFRDKVLRSFGYEIWNEREVKFRQFTDLVWYTFMPSQIRGAQIYTARPQAMVLIPKMYSADMLNSAGIDFVGVRDISEIKFEDRILTLPIIVANGFVESRLRNKMALEQCHHHSSSAFVCDYIIFLGLLIRTDEDVDLLVKKGVIDNELESAGSVTKMVKRLCEGIVFTGSDYCTIAQRLNEHYESLGGTLYVNLSLTTLRRVYFKDLWTGTATVAAVLILMMTLISTVASVLQVKQNDNKLSPPAAPPRMP